MMNSTEHLLVCLGEECNEIAKECAKALRFGLDDKVTLDPHGPRGTEGPTNREKISDELNDLMGVVNLLVHRGVIPEDWEDKGKQTAKINKVRRFMDYANLVGALD